MVPMTEEEFEESCASVAALHYAHGMEPPDFDELRDRLVRERKIIIVESHDDT